MSKVVFYDMVYGVRFVTPPGKVVQLPIRNCMSHICLDCICYWLGISYLDR